MDKYTSDAISDAVFAAHEKATLARERAINLMRQADTAKAEEVREFAKFSALNKSAAKGYGLGLPPAAPPPVSVDGLRPINLSVPTPELSLPEPLAGDPNRPQAY